MNYLLLPTSKNQESIIYHNFRYYLKTSNKDGSKYWKCGTKSCKATITTNALQVLKINGKKQDVDDDVKAIVKDSHLDDHSLKPSEIEALNSITNMKNRAKNSSESIEKIYRDEESALTRRFGDIEAVASSPVFLLFPKI